MPIVEILTEKSVAVLPFVVMMILWDMIRAEYIVWRMKHAKKKEKEKDG